MNLIYSVTSNPQATHKQPTSETLAGGGGLAGGGETLKNE